MPIETAAGAAVAKLNQVRDEIAKIIVGQQSVVDGVLICLLSGGHVLLEGVPGLGKTTLLRTLARALSLRYSPVEHLVRGLSQHGFGQGGGAGAEVEYAGHRRIFRLRRL